MNLRIRKRMMTVPATSYKQSPPNSRQQTVDIGTVDFKCYPQDSTKVVMSKNGREEISSFQLYIHGDDVVKLSESDKITCMHKDRQEPLKIDTYYLPGGIPEVGVVYLQ